MFVMDIILVGLVSPLFIADRISRHISSLERLLHWEVDNMRGIKYGENKRDIKEIVSKFVTIIDFILKYLL